MSAHTPTPWSVCEPTLCIVGPEKEGIIVAEASHLRGHDEAGANAALIVRAVNAHAALLETATDMLDEYARLSEEMGGGHAAKMRANLIFAWTLVIARAKGE